MSDAAEVEQFIAHWRDLFGQTASARVKRGTARRGTPNWVKAMVQAKGQAGSGAR